MQTSSAGVAYLTPAQQERTGKSVHIRRAVGRFQVAPLRDGATAVGSRSSRSDTLGGRCRSRQYPTRGRPRLLQHPFCHHRVRVRTPPLATQITPCLTEVKRPSYAPGPK